MRGVRLAVLVLVSAAAGGLAVLGLGRATGWTGSRTTQTFVVDRGGQRSRPAPVAVRSRALPLSGNGFSPERIYASRSSGVVTIFAFFGDAAHPDQASQGSGFVVSREGYVLTNSHVVTTAGDSPGATAQPAGRVYVEFGDHDRIAATVVGWDVFDDVGVLKLDPKQHVLTPVPLGNSSAVVPGEPVAAIGSPFGNENSVAAGIVSAVHRSIGSLTSRYKIVDAIQTDAPINHGNSGGPLFDARGRVIGINAQIRSDSGNGEGVGFAVPIDAARRSLDQLIARGRVEYAYVGIETENLTPSIARRYGYAAGRGAIVHSVEPGTPAARAGIRGGTSTATFNGDGVTLGGDVIVAINGKPVYGADDVVRIVAEQLDPGQVATFTILRGKERKTIALRLASRPT